MADPLYNPTYRWRKGENIMTISDHARKRACHSRKVFAFEILSHSHGECTAHQMVDTLAEWIGNRRQIERQEVCFFVATHRALTNNYQALNA